MRRIEKGRSGWPDLRETMKLLVKEYFQEIEDPLKMWVVLPDFADFELGWAKELIQETDDLGVSLPQGAENFLNRTHSEEYRIKWRAALTLWLIGLRIMCIKNMDAERRKRLSRFPSNFHKWAENLQLGKLSPDVLIGL